MSSSPGYAGSYDGREYDHLTFVALKPVRRSRCEVGSSERVTPETTDRLALDPPGLRREGADDSDRGILLEQLLKTVQDHVSLGEIAYAPEPTSLGESFDIDPHEAPLTLAESRDVGQHVQAVVIERLVEPARDHGMAPVVLI